MGLGDKSTVYPPGYRHPSNTKQDKPDPRTFRARLRFMLETRKKGHREFADMTGMSMMNIKQCLSGIQSPSPKQVRKMAAALDVPWQWLAGNPDAPKKFNDWLRQTMSERNMSAAKLANMAHLSRENVMLYVTGRLMPPSEKIAKIAEVLDVSPQWLAGNQ